MKRIEQIKKYLAPPVFEDEEKTRLAGLLNALLFAILIFMIFYAILVPFEHEQSIPLLLCVLAITPFWGISYVLLRQGRVKIAAVVFLAILWAIVTILALISGGLNSAAVITFIPITLAAGLLLGWRIGLVFFSLSMLTELGMLVAELSNAFPPPVFQPTPLTKGTGFAVNLVLTIVLTRLATNSIMRVLVLARRNQRALAKSHQELARREEALRESKNLFQSLIEALPQNIFAKDVEGRIIFANQRYCALEDKPLDELLGKTDFNLYPHELAQKYCEDDRRVIETGQILDIEEEHQPLDGEKIYVQVIKTPMYHADGQIFGVLGIFWDITERKQMEASLRESERRYKMVSELISDYIFRLRVEADGQVVMDSVTENYFSTTGRSLDEAKTPDLWSQIIHPDDFGELMRLLKFILTSGQPGELECRSFVKGGRMRWVHVVARPEWDEAQQRVTAILGSVKDITERKQMEASIRQARKDWEEIFQAIGHPTLILNADYTILEANRAALNATGLSEKAVKAKKCFELFHMTSENPDTCPMEKVVHSAQFKTVEMEMQALGGVYLVSCTPVLDDHGNLQKIIHIATDITARKRAEEEIQRLNAELEQRVKQRTAELEAANRELKSFAYVVSHDLKAPLRGMSRLAHWLVEDYPEAFDDKGKEMAALLIGRVKRMDSLIDGILEYSRIGRIAEDHQQIELNTLVRDVIDSLAPPDDVDILIHTALPSIVADKTRITQIFQNLIGNALKFNDKPEGKIDIRCIDKGEHWQFSIADNGPGVDERYHEKIFQIFQTLQSRDELESTGIGLALVKKIVEFHGGRIWVESTPGKGSTFSFSLPKIPEDEKYVTK